MKLPWFEVATIASSGNSALTASMVARMLRLTSTVFASACLRTATRMPRSPSMRTMRRSFS